MSPKYWCENVGWNSLPLSNTSFSHWTAKKGKNWLQKISNFKGRDNSLLSWDREDHPEFKTESQIVQIKRWFRFHFWKITCFCTSRVSCFSRLAHLQQSFSFFILTHAKLYEYSLQYATETVKLISPSRTPLTEHKLTSALKFTHEKVDWRLTELETYSCVGVAFIASKSLVCHGN